MARLWNLKNHVRNTRSEVLKTLRYFQFTDNYTIFLEMLAVCSRVVFGKKKKKKVMSQVFSWKIGKSRGQDTWDAGECAKAVPGAGPLKGSRHVGWVQAIYILWPLVRMSPGQEGTGITK